MTKPHPLLLAAAKSWYIERHWGPRDQYARDLALHFQRACDERCARFQAENNRIRGIREGEGTTHWETCWRDSRKHWECALAHVDRLQAENDRCRRIIQAAEYFTEREEEIDAHVCHLETRVCNRCHMVRELRAALAQRAEGDEDG
jgi:hypothetical protein